MATTSSTESKHTPGPWRIDVNGSERWTVDFDGPSSTYVTISGDRKEPVAFAVEPTAYGNDAEVDANARLIAAAPDLLEAARWAEAALAPFSKAPAEKSGISKLRAAIAKATGEAS